MHEGPDTGFHSIRTDRLILRRFSIDDVESFAAYRSDPVVARYQSWDPPFTQAQAQDFVDALATTSPDTPGMWFQLAVVEASSGAHIGDLAALVDEADPRLATIGGRHTIERARGGRVSGPTSWSTRRSPRSGPAEAKRRGCEVWRLTS